MPLLFPIPTVYDFPHSNHIKQVFLLISAVSVRSGITICQQLIYFIADLFVLCEAERMNMFWTQVYFSFFRKTADGILLCTRMTSAKHKADH